MRSATRCAVLAVLTLVIGLGGSGPALAGDLYGEIAVRDLKTEHRRPLDRRCRIEVITEHQRISTISQAGSRYEIHVPPEGPCQISVHYKDMVLTADISSFYHPNRYDLYIEHLDGKYRLRPVFVREYRQRPPDS